MTKLPPHVLIVLHELGTGGVERVTGHLANGLAARGNRVTLALLRGDGAMESMLDPKVEVVRLAFDQLSRGVGLLRAALRLAALTRSLGPDWLLSPGNHLHPLALLAHGLLPPIGRPQLAVKLTNPVLRPRAASATNAVRQFFFRRLMQRADLVLTLSEDSREGAVRLAPRSAGKMVVVDNPYIEDSLLERPAARLNKERQIPLLLSVGRLTEQKNPLMMLDALAGLTNERWRLVMLGEGPLRPLLEKRISQLGLQGRVLLPGFVPDPSPWFEQAHGFLLSSSYEDLPAVLLEALFARCHIVSTNCSPAVESLLGAADLVEPSDVAGFRHAVARALERPDLPPPPGPRLRRFGLRSGVASHAAALHLL